MKIVAFCSRCIREQQLETGQASGAISATDGEVVTVTAGAFIEWTCRNGHKALYWHGAPFYERLFAHAVQMLADSDMRGAVLSFYSCWDNFASYVIRILIDAAKESAPAVPKDYSLVERRVGMFAGLFFGRTSRWPILPGSDAASIRNKVIHDDKLPTEREALRVGEAVQSAITDCIARLGQDLFDSYAAGEKAEARFSRDLTAAGIDDAEAANVMAMYEAGSLVYVDVAEFVRRIRMGEPLTDPAEH